MSSGLAGVRADRGYSYQELEACAAYVRQQLRLPPHQAIDPLELFEDLHELSIKQRDDTVIPLRGAVIALEDSEGYTRYDRKRNAIEIRASEATYYRLEYQHPRAGYFVAHELGHCVLHTDHLVRLARMPTNQQAAFHRGRETHQVFQDTEWQANAFASALLMPAGAIADLEQHVALTESLIVDQFGVSYEAAGYRLKLFNNRKAELLEPR